MEGHETALDVLSRAASMVQQCKNTKLPNNDLAPEDNILREPLKVHSPLESGLHKGEISLHRFDHQMRIADLPSTFNMERSENSPHSVAKDYINSPSVSSDRRYSTTSDTDDEMIVVDDEDDHPTFQAIEESESNDMPLDFSMKKRSESPRLPPPPYYSAFNLNAGSSPYAPISQQTKGFVHQRPSVITCTPTVPVARASDYGLNPDLRMDERIGSQEECVSNLPNFSFSSKTNGDDKRAKPKQEVLFTGMCDPVIDEHFRRSLGKDYSEIFSNKSAGPSRIVANGNSKQEPRPPKSQPSLEETVSTGMSVDDHFAKALGDTWLELQKAK